MHLKRQEVPKKWPIKRKGSVYVVRPSSNLRNGMPLMIVLRDLLNIAQNRREVKRALHVKDIFINGRFPKDEKQAVLLFDVVTVKPMNKSYIVNLSKNGKFEMSQIKDSESHKKVAKVVNKKTLRGKRLQINLSDGNNFISDKKECKINDSAVVNFKDKKIEKYLPLKEKSPVIIFDGKHAGERGIVTKIVEEHKVAELDVDGKKVSVLIKQIMVLE